MKRIEIGRSVKINRLIADFNGALNENEIVEVRECLTDSIVVEDIRGQLHTISINDVDVIS